MWVAVSSLQDLGKNRTENTVPLLLYLLLRAQPSARTAQKTAFFCYYLRAVA
jgi:hypothetical protein